MDLNFERGDEAGREMRQLPAEHYKKILILFSRSESESLFIPIRSMQYLAIIDQEEIVFVDGLRPRKIDLAWRDFHPGEHDCLDSPVTYTCIYYTEQGQQARVRLQGEFLAALEQMKKRQPKSADATVTQFPRN